MDLIDDLSARGLIHDSTDLEFLRSRLDERSIGVYVGFDPTADSLHAGHLMGQLGLRRFQMAGHRPFPLAGGATGMIGDPGGRSEERNLLSRDELQHNVECIKRQLERILDFEPGPYRAELVDNADWTAGTSMLDFLRDVGKHITVNQMMAKESVKNRLASDAGISYTEFSYMLLQANDFRHLYSTHGVELQMGGSDQWGNITAGIDLIRKTTGEAAHGLTWPLLLKSDGTKFGKSAGGAVWLDPDKTSPYQFRQFWLQADDEAIVDHLFRFSTRPLDEVRGVIAEHQEAPHVRVGQRALCPRADRAGPRRGGGGCRGRGRRRAVRWRSDRRFGGRARCRGPGGAVVDDARGATRRRRRGAGGSRARVLQGRRPAHARRATGTGATGWR
jgi:tyrosyl-tRNA synthetase